MKTINLLFKFRVLEIVLIIPFSILSACSSSVKTYIPNSRFDVPEVSGEKIELSGGLALKSSSITFSDDIDVDPVNTETPEIDNNHGLITLRMSTSFLDSLEVGLLKDEIHKVSVKYMFIGKPSFEAKSGDISVAISTATGKGTTRHEETFDDEVDVSVNLKSQDAAIIGGYRVSDKVLLYSSIFNTNYKYDFSIDPKELNNYQTAYNGEINVKGMNVGTAIYFKSRSRLIFEFVSSKIETGSKKKHVDSFGANFSLFLF